MNINLIIYLLSIWLLGFTTPPKQTIFVGTIITDTENKENVIGLYIEFRVDTLVIARNIIQGDGTFKIWATADKEFDIYYRGIGVSDTYVQTIYPTDQDTVSLTFKIPRDYNKDSGKTVCPKCNRDDQTIPIIYGLKSIVVYTENQPPYTTYDGFGRKEICDGGCTNSEISPEFFCKRDKIKF